MVVQQLGPDGRPLRSVSFSLTEVSDASDRGETAYPLRKTPFGPTKSSELYNSATSVSTVVQSLAGIPIDTVSYVEVGPDGGAGPVTLDNRDLQAPGSPGYPFGGQGFPGDPNPAPDFVTSGGAIGFIRPLRQDPADVNADDQRHTSGGSALTIAVHTTGRPVLHPLVSADRTSVNPGERVGFSIHYSDGRTPTDPATYSWSFGDKVVAPCSATSTDSAAPTHVYSPRQYPEGGSANVTVSVCGGNGTGVSPSVRIQIGRLEPPTKAPTKRSGSGGLKEGAGTGANGSKGSTEGGTPSKIDGPGGRGSSSTTGSDGDAERELRASEGKNHVASSGGDVRVQGVLLDAESARSVALEAPEAAPVAAAEARRATELPRDWRWLLALLPLALLLGGVARQTPWLAGRLPRPPWRDV